MDCIEFGQFSLQLRPPGLFRHGAPVKLGGRALDILCVLAVARGETVSKNQLLDRVWPGLAVEENNLAVHISALRRELADGMDGQSLLVTVPGRGYRLIGLNEPATAQATPAPLRWDGIPGASIAVLPFENLSTDFRQEYFADGVVEDIITGLARINWLSVIARNSTFTYKGKATDINQVREELGVRYVLKGSIRRSNNRVRIVAQLIEAQSGVHLWAERYDRLLDDIFAVQDEIAMSVIGAIEPNLRKAEIERVRRKRPESLDAYDFVLRALPFVHKWMPDGAAAAIPCCRKHLSSSLATRTRMRCSRDVSTSASAVAACATRTERSLFVTRARRLSVIVMMLQRWPSRRLSFGLTSGILPRLLISSTAHWH